MGSGGWLKSLIRLKGTKQEKYKQIENAVKKSNGPLRKNNRTRQQPTETVAAITIQSAFRAYKARKALRRLRGVIRFRGVIGEDHSVKNQALSALKQIHFWSRIQAEIKDRWHGMVIEGRTRQKKLENQLKLEAKLHDLEVEWCGGPETMEEIINRIQQREEAAAKRERTMAYAFSHQWRANSSQYFGQAYYNLGKESWGWSWKERWIAVRPWENRVQTRPTTLVKKLETKHKASEITNISSLKPVMSNGKLSTHAEKISRVSHEAAQV
ncbi:hypothetical protein ACJIZ3_007140 [Penstemon smallii]|uniref:Uncharacterized protein n=1 Tax=Penstemon smallii TaxID=265156 RepID=A0ABD3S9Q0_9LAMI